MIIYEDWQKKLLEKIGTWNQKNKGEDGTFAALIYLFFQNRPIVDPPDYSDSVKLTYNQYQHLKKELFNFLPYAEKMGFDLSVKEVADAVESQLKFLTPKSIKNKNRLKSIFKLIITFFPTFIISLFLFSFQTALLIGLFCPYLFLHLNEIIKSIQSNFNKKISNKISPIIKKVNSREIEKNLKWAKNRLKKIRWL